MGHGHEPGQHARIRPHRSPGPPRRGGRDRGEELPDEGKGGRRVGQEVAVFNDVLPFAEKRINISNLNRGVYFIHFLIEKNSYSRKIILK